MRETFAAAWRVVVLRGRADWLIVAAAWLVIVLATTFLSAAVIYADAVARAGLRQVLSSAAPTDANLEISARARTDAVAELDTAVASAIASALGPARGALYRSVRSESFTLPGQDPDRITDLAVFGSHDGVDSRATLVDGRWPAAAGQPMQVALSEDAAAALGLAVGDRLELESRLRESLTVEVELVGRFAIDDPADPYWWGDELALGGLSEGATYTTHGPFLAAEDDLLDRTIVSNAHVTWRAFPNFDRLGVDDVAAVRRGVTGLEGRLASAVESRQSIAVVTELGTILAETERSLLVSRTGVLLLAVQLALLAGYALILVAGLLVDQRRAEMALLRSRGASAVQVATFALVEGVAMVVPAAVAGPFLAAGLLGLFNLVGPLAEIGLTLELAASRPAFVVAGLAAVACVVALVVPALVSASALASVRRGVGRQALTTITQRGGADVVLLVVAAIGLWQLRQYGAPITRSLRGDLGLDPFLVAAPAIGLLAGGLLALRILPLGASAIERLLSRRPGLVGSIGSRQLARRPLRYTRSALLLMLAAALGVFAAAYTGTWIASQRDQADYQVAADVRLQQPRFTVLPAWAYGAAYAGVDGVERAMPVVADRFTMRGSPTSAQLVGLDAAHAAEVVAFRPDLADRPLGELMSALESSRPQEAGTAPIAGEPRRLAVTMELDLTTAEPEFGPIPPGWGGASLSLVIRDAGGIIHRLDPRRLTYDGGVQRVEVGLTVDLGDERAAVHPTYPIELVAIELGLTPPAEMAAVGHVELRAVEASGEPSGDDWEAVPLDVSGGEWRWLRVQAGTEAQPAPTDPALPGRVRIDEERPNRADPADSVVIRPSALDRDLPPLRAIVNDRFSALTGAGLGDTTAVPRVTGTGELVQISSVVRGFPTADPDAPFLVVDAPSLALAAYASGGRVLNAGEWWLTTAPGRGDEVGQRLAAAPFGEAAIEVRASRAESLLTDPVALGVVGALFLGAAAAAGFAVVGFTVSAAVAARERVTEFALLRAMGLSPRQLSAWLSLESAVLLLSGLVGGVALGFGLAWLVLPFVTLSQGAASTVPPPEVVVPWEVVGLMPIAGIGVLLVAIALLVDVLRRLDLSGTLRMGDE